MNKYLYIHIGIPKTGTTAIQKFCDNNRESLLEHNILYPNVCIRGYGHHDLAFLVNGEYPDWASKQEKTLDEVLDELLTSVSGYQGSVLLSSENFYLYPNPILLKESLLQRNIISEFSPKIIIYLRHQVYAHESWYNQTIKAQGYTHSINESIKKFAQLFNYEENLKKWANVFGRENIIVRIYPEKTDNKFELISDFISILDIHKLDLFKKDEEKVNTYLNKDLLEYQRQVNKLPVPAEEKRLFHKDLIELTKIASNTGIFNESSTITAEHSELIMEMYQKSNQIVAQNYLASQNLFENFSKNEQFNSLEESNLTTNKLAIINHWLLLKLKREQK